jgi:hypothetical protein
VIDVGLLRAADGRYAYGQGGAKVDRDGKVWFVGAFEEPNPKLAANKEGRRQYSLGLGCYDPFSASKAGTKQEARR